MRDDLEVVAESFGTCVTVGGVCETEDPAVFMPGFVFYNIDDCSVSTTTTTTTTTTTATPMNEMIGNGSDRHFSLK